MRLGLGGRCVRLWWLGSSTDRLHVAQVLGLEELVHGHLVHGGEVGGNYLLTVPLLVVAEVLLKVQGVLSNPEGIIHVGLDHLQTLNTLLTGVSEDKS